MFELDGDFDLDEDFLQGVFESEAEAAKKITGIETKGEKRSSLKEDCSLSTKKHKLSSNEHDSSQFKIHVPCEDNSKVCVNITNIESEASGKLSSVHEVRNINLNAGETKFKLVRKDTSKQSSLRIQLDTSSNDCANRSTPAMFNSRANTPLGAQHGHCGDSVSIEIRPACAEITPQRSGCLSSRVSRTVRQRKFPGPAGLLPYKDHMMNRSSVSTPSADVDMLQIEDPLYSQSSSSTFEGAAWLQMLRDFELSDNRGPLSQFTVGWVKRRAAARQLLHQKVPFLVTVLHDLDCSSPDPCVVLQDRTGEIHGTLHREVWEQYGGQLQPGSVLVLRQVGVLSTGITARRHYLNVTCNNIISIYSTVLRDETAAEDISEVRTTRVHQVTCSELLKSASDWQARQSAPETSPAYRTANAMFSTVGSPAHLSSPYNTLKQSGGVTGNVSPLSSRPNGWQQIRSSVPNSVRGTTLPKTDDKFLGNSINSKDNTRTENSLNYDVQIRKTNLQNASIIGNSSNDKSTILNSSAAFNVMGTTGQSMFTSPWRNVLESPQQVQKEKPIETEIFTFQPQFSTPASYRRKTSDSPHQSDKGKSVESEGFNFQPQPTPAFSFNRTDTVAPATFKGGFTPKVSRFGSSELSLSQASCHSEAPTFFATDSGRTSEPTANIANHLQKTPNMSLKYSGETSVSYPRGSNSSTVSSERSSRLNKYVTEAESSVLDVLEGLDTSTLFDEF